MKAATKDQIMQIKDTAISIHAAREGGDAAQYLDTRTLLEFQSTPPVKAATNISASSASKTVISIHAAREGGDPTRPHQQPAASISIHAAREGGDCSRNYRRCCHRYFNPRRP